MEGRNNADVSPFCTFLWVLPSFSHFQGIHPNTSQWIINNRKVKLVGIDTASLDYGQSTEYKTHQILYNKNIPGLENVAHMDKLPTKGFTVYAAPMFISNGSGGPCRIFARLDENGGTVNSAVTMKHTGLIVVITVFLFFSFL